MTKLSARVFSVSDLHLPIQATGRVCLDERDLHIWLCLRDRIANSDEFKRRVLSRYAEVVPTDLRFGLGEQGKPYLVGSLCPLDFNLSHSGDWLVCAVTAGAPVGVDIEECNPTRDVMTLARRFFRAEEVEILAACSEASRRDRFYDFWTLKESAVKARGGALVSGLDSRGFAVAFNCDSEQDSGRIALTTRDEDCTAQYCLLDLLPGYRLAICWLPGMAQQPKLQVFELGDPGVSSTRHLPLRASTWVD